MAIRTAKLRVELDGEKKYKEAIAEINRESKTLGAEMKKLAAEYKGNENSIEALTKKQTLLDRALLESKAKVEETRKQLDSWRAALERVRQEQGASSEEYKQAQKKVQEYEYALANAETAQIELENAIRDNNEALEDSRDALDETNDELEETEGTSKTLGDQIQGLADKFGIKLPDGAKKALDGMRGWSTGTVAAIGAVTTAVTLAYQAYKKLFDMTLEQSKAADELITKSMQSGVSTETLQQWEYASAFIDVSADTITGALSKITKAAADNKDAFGKLGVAVTDSGGQLRDSEEILWDTLRALSEIPNETERNAIAQELLGKSYEELNPLILNMDEAQRRYNEALEKGYVLSDEQIQKLGEVDDAVEENRLMFEGLEKQLSVQFAGAAKDALNLFGDLMEKAGKALVDSRLIENLGLMLQGILDIIEEVTSFTDLIPGWMNPIKQLSDAFYAVGLVLAGVADALQLVIGLMPANWGSGMVSSALGFGYSSGNANHLQRAQMAHAGTLDMYDEFYAGRNAIGNDNWRGGLTWVGEAGPELVSLPRGSQILNAQDSRNMGGGQVININVQGIQQLDEIVSWYESRRVRGRMA